MIKDVLTRLLACCTLAARRQDRPRAACGYGWCGGKPQGPARETTTRRTGPASAGAHTGASRLQCPAASGRALSRPLSARVRVRVRGRGIDDGPSDGLAMAFSISLL